MDDSSTHSNAKESQKETITNEQYKYTPIQRYKDEKGRTTTIQRPHSYVRSPRSRRANACNEGGGQRVAHVEHVCKREEKGTHEVFGLDGDALGVNGGEVGVLKAGDQVSLRGFLESHDGGGLEAEVRLQGRRQLKTQRLVHGGDKP